MLSVQELRRLSSALPLPTFLGQIGPFALVQRPTSERAAALAQRLGAGGTAMAHREGLAQSGLQLLPEFDDLLVATLPPVRDADALTAGRLPDCELVVNDPSVSKRHALLRWESARKACVVQDLGSSNGTFINGSRISGPPTALRTGDILSFGDAQYWYLRSDDLYAKLVFSAFASPRTGS